MEKINNEVDLINDILYKHKIDDVVIDTDDNNYIILHDDDNIWIGKEAYDFMFNELFVYNNGKVDLISDEDIKQLNEYKTKYNDSNNIYDNVLWHHGIVVDMKYEGEYRIFATGVVNCELIAKKTFINNCGENIKKGDVLVNINDKSESGLFKEKMSLYIKDDSELEKILSNNHELYKLKSNNTNRYKMIYLNDDDEKEFDDFLKSINLRDAIKESVKIIQDKSTNREEKNLIIRENLYSKMNQEYENFIEKLEKLSAKEILDNSYEKVMKEEILNYFYPESENYFIWQIKALNNSETPLDDLYQDWLRYDSGISELIEESICDSLDSLKQEDVEKAKQKSTFKER